MPSVTTWTRLEPNPRAAAMEETLKARIYDPLWLLARQWQLGEFQGEDNGSPVSVSLQGEASQLTRFAPGPSSNTPVQADRFDPANIPLEVLVERERARPLPNAIEKLHFAAEAGQHFLRMLARESFGTLYHAAIIAKFPLPRPSPDQTSAAGPRDLKFLTIMSGRVPDGAATANALRQSDALSSVVRAEHQTAVQKVAEAFIRWYDQLFSEPGGAKDDAAWLPNRMEYGFAVSAVTPGPSFTTAGGTGGETVLVAREYSSGHLDWLDFDLRQGAALGAAADRAAGRNPVPLDQTVIPSPVTFRGMPAPRWWEFEDAAVDFGAVEPDPQDLARMLMLEFAISYGNDWFVVPLDLPVGSVCRITSVIVTDTFGVRTMIPSIGGSTHPAASTWRMFAHSNDRVAAASSLSSALRPPDNFFLAPALMRTIEGKPLEEVLFLRDEMANLAWGVEGTVEGPSGRAVDRRQIYAERRPGAPAPSSARKDALVWRVASDVPDYWIPLIPVQLDKTSGAIAFRRGATLRPDGSRSTQSAQSRALMPDPQNQLDIFEEEIPREGARVTRAFQYARWFNGAPLLWIGRRKLPGRGEGSSGLKFDRAIKTDGTNSQ
ncbi:MAG TPA: hypothetical protein VIB79_12970 [Candidatus Binatia bacterium]